MVYHEAQRLGLEPGESRHLLELPAFPGEDTGIDTMAPDDYLGTEEEAR
jgi:hypothetical protein